MNRLWSRWLRSGDVSPDRIKRPWLEESHGYMRKARCRIAEHSEVEDPAETECIRIRILSLGGSAECQHAVRQRVSPVVSRILVRIER